MGGVLKLASLSTHTTLLFTQKHTTRTHQHTRPPTTDPHLPQRIIRSVGVCVCVSSSNACFISILTQNPRPLQPNTAAPSSLLHMNMEENFQRRTLAFIHTHYKCDGTLRLNLSRSNLRSKVAAVIYLGADYRLNLLCLNLCVCVMCVCVCE